VNRMSERPTRPALTLLARKIEGQPWNRPGSDKTWVLDAMWQRLRFQGEIRPAAARPVPHAAGR